MARIIGIDLGTTNAVCACLEGGEPRILLNEEGARITPSVVGFSDNGERLVGEIARRQLLLHPDRTVHSIKRFIGKRYESCTSEMDTVAYPVVQGRAGEIGVEIGERVYAPQEISAMVLKKLKTSAENYLGSAVEDAIITVPAYFTDRQRQATRDAGEIAGLNVLRIINEPTAAALAYVYKRRRQGTIAIYDFGGGTFDISILDVDSDLAEVRATGGNNSLGGNDVDQVLVDWLCEQFLSSHGLDPRENKIVMQRLRDAAERAKMDLSMATETQVHLPFLMADETGAKHLECKLTRKEFEQLIEPLVEKTLDCCRSAMEELGLQPGDIQDVILVGGSSRIPLVQELVQEFFGCPLNKSFNPDEVVAIGAALQAASLEGSEKSVTLLDVTSFSLGIEVAGRRFAKLIPKNSTLPVSCERMVSTAVDNQSTVRIHVLQGEGEYTHENVSLGEFELTGIGDAPRGEPRIAISFHIDANGMVQISAEDTRSGVAEALTIEAPTSLTQSEIQALREESEDLARDQAERQKLKAVKHELERRLSQGERFLRQRKGLLHRLQQAEFEQGLQRARMALLKSEDQQNLESLALYLQNYQLRLEEEISGDL